MKLYSFVYLFWILKQKMVTLVIKSDRSTFYDSRISKVLNLFYVESFKIVLIVLVRAKYNAYTVLNPVHMQATTVLKKLETRFGAGLCWSATVRSEDSLYFNVSQWNGLFPSGI